MLAGTGTTAAAQAEPAGAEIRQMVAGCVPPARPAGGPTSLSAAARTAALSCVARESARLIGGQLPMRIDEITTLRSVAADGPQLTYLNDVEVDGEGLTAEQSEALMATTRDYVCSQPLMRAAVSAGSSYRYIWFDRSGAEFNRMTIDRCEDEADDSEEAVDPDDETPPVTIARRGGAPGANG
jgi:hypothetical protein